MGKKLEGGVGVQIVVLFKVLFNVVSVYFDGMGVFIFKVQIGFEFFNDFVWFIYCLYFLGVFLVFLVLFWGF